MADGLPIVLRRLLEASTPSLQEASWERFLSDHSRLILHVTRSVCPEDDGAMDMYAFILDQLRQNDYRRLRTYAADGRSQFSTWLVVVAQRLCVDFRRRQYGRHRPADGTTPDSALDRAARRRLVDLLGADVDLESLADPSPTDAERLTGLGELHGLLESALSGLPARDQLLIKLRFEDELSIRDIAIALGLSTRFHVYRRLNYVLARLRASLARRGVTDPGS